MTVLIDNRSEYDLSDIHFKTIKACIKETLIFEGLSNAFEVSVSIVDNKEIQNINSKFRKIDKPTDVLSFPLIGFPVDERVEKSESGKVLLGDIIISIEKATKQAEEYGHSLEREIGFLTVHSMLHLLGYDHMKKTDEDDMFLRQEKILEGLNICR